MGCCASKETVNDPVSQPETASSPRALNTNDGYNVTPAMQPSAVLSTSSSRAPLTTANQEASAASSPRQSRRGRRRRASQIDDNLSEHYNIPLLPPKPWTSNDRTWTPSQLQKERQDFFDTRVAGQREIWEALRQVAECIRGGEIDTAQGILSAVSCTLPTGRVEEGVYDERGELYRVPPAILSDPQNMLAEENADGDTVVGVGSPIQDKLDLNKSLENIPEAGVTKGDSVPTEVIDKGKSLDNEPHDAIKIKCRLATTGADKLVTIGKSQPLSVLVQKLKEEATPTSSGKLRIFYLGRELKEKQTLEEQDFKEGSVLQVFVSGGKG